MQDQLLPTTIPIATAALLAGLSPATFKQRCLATGLVAAYDRQVSLASLAAYLGRPIAIEEFLMADRRRDPARARQRQYCQRKEAA
jgi:hypothetical protein